MSKKKSRRKSKPAASHHDAESEAPPRYEIRVPREKGDDSPLYSGLHPLGVKFSDGVGSTEDGDIADELEAKGFEVNEVGTSNAANSQKLPEE